MAGRGQPLPSAGDAEETAGTNRNTRTRTSQIDLLMGLLSCAKRPGELQRLYISWCAGPETPSPGVPAFPGWGLPSRAAVRERVGEKSLPSPVLFLKYCSGMTSIDVGAQYPQNAPSITSSFLDV